MTSLNRLLFLLFLTLVLLIPLTSCGGSEEDTIDLPLTLTASAPQEEGQGQTEAVDRAKTEEEPPQPTEVTPEPTIAPQLPEGDKVPEPAIFTVRPDGFGFRNYGRGFPEGDFTITDLRTLFGDGVCSRIEGDECVPTAEAQQWIADRNADMVSGHCIGFTVASYRLFGGDFQPAAFTADANATFDIRQAPNIMRTIAANGSLYWVKSVWSSEVSGTPKEVVEALIALGEPADLSIYLPGLGGGHSLLAYGVEEVEPDIYHILTYDNNYPGEETYVVVDASANTWHYDQGAVNPDQEAVPYQGDATTETLRFIPLSAYEDASCPFCPADAGPAEEKEGFNLLSFFGRGQALVNTDSGSTSLEAGQSSNNIPGAQLIYQRGQMAADEIPDVALPSGSDFSVTFRGLERVSSINDNFSLLLDNLGPTAARNQLAVDPVGQSFVYTAGENQTPVLKAVLHQGDAAYAITLLGLNIGTGQDLSMGLTPGGEGLALSGDALDLSQTILLISRLNDAGESIFGTSALDLGQAHGLALDLSRWDGQNTISQFVDMDGDGSFEQPLNRLANESLDQILRQSDPKNVFQIVNSLSPYLDDPGMQAVLAVLPNLFLPSRTLGQILQSMGLNDEQLLAVISSTTMSIPELSELIFNLRLDQGQQDALVTGLGLGDQDGATLQVYLSNLDNLHGIFLDWEFLNSNDPQKLLAFLGEQNLSGDQITELLPKLALNAAETASVLGELDLSSPDVEKILTNSDFSSAELEEIQKTLGLSDEMIESAAGEGEGTVTPTQNGTPTAESTAMHTATPAAAPTRVQNPTAAPTSQSDQNSSPEPTSTPALPPTAAPTVDQSAGESPAASPTPEPYPGS